MKCPLLMVAAFAASACAQQSMEVPGPPRQANRAAELTALPPAENALEALEPVYQVGGDVIPPKRLRPCRPDTTRLGAITDGREITQPFFMYEVIVSARGEVTSVTLLKASQQGEPYEDMEREFRRALVQCTFEPATRQGVPVAVRFLMHSTAEVR